MFFSAILAMPINLGLRKMTNEVARPQIWDTEGIAGEVYTLANVELREFKVRNDSTDNLVGVSQVVSLNLLV